MSVRVKCWIPGGVCRCHIIDVERQFTLTGDSKMNVNVKPFAAEFTSVICGGLFSPRLEERTCISMFLQGTHFNWCFLVILLRDACEGTQGWKTRRTFSWGLSVGEKKNALKIPVKREKKNEYIFFVSMVGYNNCNVIHRAPLQHRPNVQTGACIAQRTHPDENIAHRGLTQWARQGSLTISLSFETCSSSSLRNSPCAE